MTSVRRWFKNFLCEKLSTTKNAAIVKLQNYITTFNHNFSCMSGIASYRTNELFTCPLKG